MNSQNLRYNHDNNYAHDTAIKTVKFIDEF